MWRVLLIDDHTLLTSALVAAFEQDGRAVVVGTATTLAGGAESAAELTPDVILTDRRLPDGDADQHLGVLRDASPASRILLMTGWPTARSSLAALEGGACGIVSKARSVVDIIDAVGRVVAGDLVLPSGLAATLVRDGGSRSTSRTELSMRELDVLEALACGESTAAAAERLCMSSNTLRNHLARAMLKLGTHSRIAAISEAVRLGLVSPPLPGVEALRAGA